jgi:hypothetical protein
MMALLRYLYALPYATVDSEDVEEACLHPHALVYIVAEKYQATRLRYEAYKNMVTIIGTWGIDHYSFVDFPAAFRTIFTATLPTNKARALMLQVCIAGLPQLRENDDFESLLLDFPDLGVEIIKHSHLAGDWLCPDGPDCDGLPTCFSCVETKEEYTEPLEPSFAHKHRDQEKWPCPSCGSLITPKCLMCEGVIRWTFRGRTREFERYNRSPQVSSGDLVAKSWKVDIGGGGNRDGQ